MFSAEHESGMTHSNFLLLLLLLLLLFLFLMVLYLEQINGEWQQHSREAGGGVVADGDKT